MSKQDLHSPELYINRELSWLEFNDHVLREGLNPDLPLLERAKFLAIVSSNLDEFFMVRVGGLYQQCDAGLRRRDPSGLTPNQQISKINERAARLVHEQSEGISELIKCMKAENLCVLRTADWNTDQRLYLQDYFVQELQPILTPLAMQNRSTDPLLPNLQLNVALLMRPENRKPQKPSKELIIIPVPKNIPRFVSIPDEQGVSLALLDDIIVEFAAIMMNGFELHQTAIFRITRDADVTVKDNDADEDLLHAIKQAVTARKRRSAVRLELSAGAPQAIRSRLCRRLGLSKTSIYDIDGIIDATAFFELASREGCDRLKVETWSPQLPVDLIGNEDLYQTLNQRDVMIFTPYESFDPVVELIQNAADDPNVLAIKQTLYRTSGNSPIIRTLEHAAENGKQVTVLVELKARFDEERNVNWARRLEDAGCIVIYGIAGLKTHAKALLVIRRERGRIQRYVHLATGNYNDKTAKLYSDLMLMTTDNDIATDVASFFNLLTGYSETVGWSDLTIAPTDLRNRFEQLIEREIHSSTADHPGLIMAKVNSLQDRDIIRSLYRASQAGVRVLLNVRGICCLRPGIKGVSENIEVRSIVDRYLEHARVYYFRNGGHPETYLSSADWMRRNLDRRLELLFPVKDPRLMQRVMRIMDIFFSDNVKARILQSDGSYTRVEPGKSQVRAQEVFHNQTVEATQTFANRSRRFKPLKKSTQ